MLTTLQEYVQAKVVAVIFECNAYAHITHAHKHNRSYFVYVFDRYMSNTYTQQ